MEYLGHLFLWITVNVSKSGSKPYNIYMVNIFGYWHPSHNPHVSLDITLTLVISLATDLVNICYRVSNIIYTAIKIEKQKNVNKSNRLGKYWNINLKRSRSFLYLLNEPNHIYKPVDEKMYVVEHPDKSGKNRGNISSNNKA